VLSVFGAKLARAIALSTFPERVWHLAVPMAYRACVKISMASMTGSHHYLPPMCGESEPDVTSPGRLVAERSVFCPGSHVNQAIELNVCLCAGVWYDSILAGLRNPHLIDAFDKAKITIDLWMCASNH
jgi:hypothetical protein